MGIEQLIDKALTEARLDHNLFRRMEGLVLQRELKDLEISAVEVAQDLQQEGFELVDIAEYLKIAVEGALGRLR